MHKLEVLQEWYNRVWLNGDYGAIGEFFTAESRPEGIMQGLALMPEDFAELIPAIMARVMEPSFEVLRFIEAGDWIWVLMVLRAKGRADGHPIEVTGQLSVRFEGDLIAEAYNHYDFIAFFEQLGALPENTMALCLSGEALR